MLNAVKYHPERLDSCPAVGVRIGWLLAQRWDAALESFCCLEKLKIAFSQSLGNGLQKDRR